MAKTLIEQCQSARGPGYRTASLLELIEKVEARRDHCKQEAEGYDDSSIDLTFDAEERAEFAEAAERNRRDERIWAREVLELRKILDKRLNSEVAVAKRAAFDAARAEHDELVVDLRREWPELQARMITLLRRIQSSDARVEQANTLGVGRLESAEADARGVPAIFRDAVSPIARLTAIRFPNFTGSGLAWPKPLATFSGEGALMMAEAAARTAKLDKDYDRSRVRKPFTVTSPRHEMTMISASGKQIGVDQSGPANVMMTEPEAEAARSAGLAVEPAKPTKAPSSRAQSPEPGLDV